MDDSGRAMRRKDTSKNGAPLRILSLDGGGIRGYSMLIILQELMHRTFVEMEGRAPKRHEIPKPCNHFDLIAGTGTGGLIALMLGRLRLDLDTCKDLYVRMTKRVFETDKTFLGMPYKGTMFKASKLEEVIKEVAREHTIFDDEGNDALANATPMTPITPSSAIPGIPQRTSSQSSRYSQIGMSPTTGRGLASLHFGDHNALLYDTRENRTKTAVTAVLKGTSTIALLRSYDSRKESAPDVNCTIWQAGRATSATQMAFKPIQIGQSVYLDEGAGKYNPSPQILDEAVQNEWPGREVGIFVSIGTGKRPASTGAKSHEWWEDLLGGSMSDFAEARRRLISKLEGCEESHNFMLQDHLKARGVSLENYFRLNVEIGVGEFGMNEWNRLSEISTNTRSYLSRADVESLTLAAAAKIAKIHFSRVRQERADARKQAGPEQAVPNHTWQQQSAWDSAQATSHSSHQNFAVELQGDDTFRPGQQYHRDQIYPVEPDSAYMQDQSMVDQKYSVVGDGYDQSSPSPYSPNRTRSGQQNKYSPQQVPARLSGDYSNQVRFSANSSRDNSPAHRQDHQGGQSPPPIPPKTPVNANPPYAYSPDHIRSPSTGGPRTFVNMADLARKLPYPDTDEPPPMVNRENKPTIS